MPNEHPLILDRRILFSAIREQVALVKETSREPVRSNWHQAEAHRLAGRLLQVQQRIEDLDLD